MNPSPWRVRVTGMEQKGVAGTGDVVVLTFSVRRNDFQLSWFCLLALLRVLMVFHRVLWVFVCFSGDFFFCLTLWYLLGIFFFLGFWKANPSCLVSQFMPWKVKGFLLFYWQEVRISRHFYLSAPRFGSFDSGF